MILYSIMLDEHRLDWAGTQAEARSSTLQHQTMFPKDQVTWCETIVPVDKPSLLAWLKENATTKLIEDTVSGEWRVKK